MWKQEATERRRGWLGKRGSGGYSLYPRVSGFMNEEEEEEENLIDKKVNVADVQASLKTPLSRLLESDSACLKVSDLTSVN